MTRKYIFDGFIVVFIEYFLLEVGKVLIGITCTSIG